MLQTVKALVDEQGHIHYLEPMHLTAPRQALIIFLDENNEAPLLAQANLSKEWLHPEEDRAWAHLQPAK